LIDYFLVKKVLDEAAIAENTPPNSHPI